MRPPTQLHSLARQGRGPKLSRAGRGLVLAALAVMVGAGRLAAQQTAAIQVSAVVAPSFVDVALAPAAAGGAADAARSDLAWSPGTADARLVRVRGVSGASLRAMAGRSAAEGACSTGATIQGTAGAAASGARTLCVLVEYPAT